MEGLIRFRIGQNYRFNRTKCPIQCDKMSDSIGQNYALTIPNNYTQKLYRVTIPNITRPNRPRTHHLKRINIAEKGGRSTYPPTLPRYPFSKGDRDATKGKGRPEWVARNFFAKSVPKWAVSFVHEYMEAKNFLRNVPKSGYFCLLYIMGGFLSVEHASRIEDGSAEISRSSFSAIFGDYSRSRAIVKKC